MYTDDYLTVNAVLHGDKDGYEKLVDKYKKMVYGIAWSHLGDPDLSEDAAQETFVKAYTYLGTLREPDKFAGWLARIARNVCGSLGRGIKRENAFHNKWAVLESAEAEPQEEDRESLSRQLWDSFAKLPTIHREALTLFYVEGKSIAEASAALGIAEQTMRTRLHRARTALRAQLEQMLEESLSDLQPSRGFTRSVLVLLPMTPKGAIGAGGALALGKLLAGLSFALWMAAAQALAMLGLFTMYSKLDEASLEDKPETQPIKAFIRRNYMIAVAAMSVTFVVFVLLVLHRNESALYALAQISCIGYAYMMWLAFKPLRVNTSTAVIGNALAIAIIFISIVAFAFFHASPYLFFIAGLLTSIIVYFTNQKMPQRFGFNLFTGSALGIFGDFEDDQSLGRRLTRTELLSFAKFLGGLWLVNDYRWRGDGITLFAGFSKRVTITWNGACTATMSAKDLKGTRQLLLAGRSVEAAELQDNACRVVRYALNCFLRGDLEAVHKVLSLDGTPSAQSLTTARHNRVKSLVGVWLMLMVFVQFFVTHLVEPSEKEKELHHFGVGAYYVLIVAAAGFLVAIIAMAITLCISKRQMSSTQDSQKLMRPKESTSMNVTQDKKTIIPLLAFVILALGLIVVFVMIKGGSLPERGQIRPIPRAVVAYPDLEFPPCDNYGKAAFRFWHPADITTIKGVAVLVPGVNGDGRWMAHYPLYKSFAERHGFALVACYFTNPVWPFKTYCQANMGSGAALLEALRLFAAQSGHPEVENAPLILWGHSAGGQFNYEFACWKPERVIAFIVNKGGCYYTEEPSPETRRVPALFFIGAKDEDSRINNITKFFHGGRDKGALWALAVEPNAGHEVGGTRELAMRFFETIIPLRLNASGKLVPLNETAGWIGDLTTFTISRAQAGGNHTGSWLPSEPMAKRWQAFVTTGLHISCPSSPTQAGSYIP